MDRPLTVVTGASSGLGAAFARRLAADGYDAVLVARRRERLDALAQELQRDHGVAVESIVADLTTLDGAERVAARIDRGPAPAIVVNNAGFGGFRPLVESSSADIDALVFIHVRTVARLTHAAARAMLASGGGGAIVNVASRLALAGSLPSDLLPHRAVYAGAKAFQLAFSQTLAGELRSSGVVVQTLLPGIVRTEFHGPGGVHAPPHMVMEPEQVVEESLAALERGDSVCAPGLGDPGLIGLLGKVERAIVLN
jgi:short-subunit dehydrogenase